jgi:acetyl esterase/lipase
MHLRRATSSWVATDAHRRSGRASRRARRSISPQGFDILEDRALLSLGHACAASVPQAVPGPFFPQDFRPGLRDSRRELNVPFPTVNGGTERLDVYMPAGLSSAVGRPVLIAIHGGGWRRLDKAGYGARIASAFVPRGYVVIAPNYQLSARGKPSWPANLDDLQAAVRWVRQNASSLGIDSNRIAAIGESAGANLAALLGAYSGPGAASSSSVQAVVAFSTPTDLAALASESPAAGWAAAQFLGGTPGEVPANYTAASPVDHVSASEPPMFLVQGREDSLIPFSQSVLMSSVLSAAGVRNRLVLVRGGHDLDFPEHYRNLVGQILEFLDATWKD